MAYISIDLEDYIDEVDDKILIDELKRRAKRKGKTFAQFVKEKDKEIEIKIDMLSKREEFALSLGLNRFASITDIVDAVNEKLR